MLVLGKWTQDYLPGAYVQFLRFMGRELADPISDEEAIGGSIADVLRRLDEKLNGHNRTAVDFMSGGRTAYQHLSNRSDTADHPQRDHAPHLRVDQRPCACPLVRGSNRNHQPRRSLRESNRRQLRSRGRSRLSQSKRGGCHENPSFVQRFGLGIPIAQSLLAQAGHPEIEFTVDQSGISATIRTASRKEGPR